MNKTNTEFLQEMYLNSALGGADTENSKDNINGKSALIWHHVSLKSAEAQDWLDNESKLDPMVVGALSAEETRPRSFKNKDGMLIILRGVNLNPGHNPEDMVSVRMWLDPHRIVTVTRRAVTSIKDIMNDVEHHDAPASSGVFLVELINKLASRIGEFTEKLDEELEQVEQGIEDIHASEMRVALSSLRKQIAMIRRYLSPQRDTLDRLSFLETNIFSERDRLRLREESDRISRQLEDLDLARERAVFVHEALLSQIAQQQNARMYALSIITAVFLPLGFVTGLLGINVGGMPGADNPDSFWLVCVGLSFLSAFIVLAFRKMHWL